MRRTLLLVVAASLLAVPTLAESVQTFVGNTTGLATWHRPEFGDPPVTVNGSSTPPFSVQSFKILNNAYCYVVSAVDFDATLYLYHGGFSAISPLTDIVSGANWGLMNGGTSFLPHSGPPHTLALAAGTYYLVTSGYQTTDFGTFQNTIHCEAAADSTYDPTSHPGIVQGSCGTYSGRPVEDTVCLGNRFLVEIVDVTNSVTGIGVPVRIGSNDTALYWFYNDTNFEVMLKVLNGCAVNSRYWVFGGALTNQGYRIVVTDSYASGHPQKQYINALGTRAAAIADTDAFATCP